MAFSVGVELLDARLRRRAGGAAGEHCGAGAPAGCRARRQAMVTIAVEACPRSHRRRSTSPTHRLVGGAHHLHHEAAHQRAGDAGQPRPRPAEGRAGAGRVRRRTSMTIAYGHEGRQCADGHHFSQSFTGNRPPMIAARTPVWPCWWKACGGADVRGRRTAAAGHRATSEKIRACAIGITGITEVRPARRRVSGDPAMQALILVQRQRHGSATYGICSSPCRSAPRRPPRTRGADDQAGGIPIGMSRCGSWFLGRRRDGIEAM